MPKFIKLTSIHSSAAPVHIRADRIIAVGDQASQERGGCSIYDGSPDPFEVRETAEEVLKILEALP